MTKRGPDKTQPDDRRTDKTVEDSFPASDPRSHSGITGVGAQRDRPAASGADERPASHKRGDEARPTGYPNSDRHAAETAHAWEDEA